MRVGQALRLWILGAQGNRIMINISFGQPAVPTPQEGGFQTPLRAPYVSEPIKGKCNRPVSGPEL